MTNNVLIVDDSVVIRQMIKRTLVLAGLDVGETFEAGNGIEALGTLSDHDIAVILVDINMPIMNGIQLVNRMKGNERLKHIPLVIVSTEGSQERIQELERSGISGYLRKPFRPEELRDVLAPLLGVTDDATDDNSDAQDGLF